MNTRRKVTVLGIVTCLIFGLAVFADPATNMIYEAENAEETSGVTIKGLDTGALGSGYVDFGSQGCFIRWTRVLSGEGETVLTFRYSAKDGGRRTILLVNGSEVDLTAWKPTGNWKIWATYDVSATLIAGNNTIELRQSSKEGPNIDQMIVHPKSVTFNMVPDVVGLSQADAESKIISAGLVVGTVTTEYSGTVAAGMVICQSLPVGMIVSIGSSIDLVISLGAQTVGQKGGKGSECNSTG